MEVKSIIMEVLGGTRKRAGVGKMYVGGSNTGRSIDAKEANDFGAISSGVS